MSHPEGSPLPPGRPHLERSLKPSGVALHAQSRLPCTMPKASSVLVLAGLLVLWAELPPASAQNVTSEYERTAPAPCEQPASLPAPGPAGDGVQGRRPRPAPGRAVLSSIPGANPGAGSSISRLQTAALALLQGQQPRAHPHRVPLPFSESRRVPGPSDRGSELHSGVPVRWRLREHPQVLPGGLWQGLPGAQR